MDGGGRPLRNDGSRDGDGCKGGRLLGSPGGGEGVVGTQR